MCLKLFNLRLFVSDLHLGLFFRQIGLSSPCLQFSLQACIILFLLSLQIAFNCSERVIIFVYHCLSIFRRQILIQGIDELLSAHLQISSLVKQVVSEIHIDNIWFKFALFGVFITFDNIFLKFIIMVIGQFLAQERITVFRIKLLRFLSI